MRCVWSTSRTGTQQTFANFTATFDESLNPRYDRLCAYNGTPGRYLTVYYEGVRSNTIRFAAPAGTSTPPPEPAETDATVPLAPRSLRLTRVDADSFRISWDSPSRNGGAVITSYRAVISRPAVSSSIPAWQRTYTYGSTETSRTFSGRLGATYTVRLAATNRVGTSSSVTATYSTDPNPTIAPPSAPRSLRLTRVDADSFRISWDSPSRNGGAVITSYRAVISRPAVSSSIPAWQRTYTYGSTETSRTFSGRLGATYTVRLAATNRVGTSSSVTATYSTDPNPTIAPPSAPRSLRLTRVDADSFRISWDSPSRNGGAVITSYRAVISRPAVSSSIPAWQRTYTYGSTETSRTFSGRLGATYTVRLAATNRAGTGPSATDTYTILRPQVRVPGAVEFQITRVPDDNNSFNILWSPPDDDGGSPITGYLALIVHGLWGGGGARPRKSLSDVG